MHPEIAFTKYEGLGNDFIVVDAPDERAVTPQLAATLCDRRFGVGADGVLVVLPPRSGECDARMRVINADGSVPEMCGNGARCVALHVARARRIGPGDMVRVRLDTDAGVRACDVDGVTSSNASAGLVTVDMGAVRVTGETTIDVGGESVLLALADAGNPHAVTFGHYGRGDVERLGSRIAVDKAFPRGTNVEFAHVGATSIGLTVWERGVGVTLACGTGACATVAVACAKGLAPRGRPVAVDLPGGRLEVTIDEDGRATMRGPARFVFSGAVPAA